MKTLILDILTLGITRPVTTPLCLHFTVILISHNVLHCELLSRKSELCWCAMFIGTVTYALTTAKVIADLLPCQVYFHYDAPMHYLSHIFEALDY